MGRYSLSDDLDDENDDVEPPHPMGFGSQWKSRTAWIGLDPPILSSPGRCCYALDDGDEEEEKMLSFVAREAYPPLSAFIPKASTPLLLKYRGGRTEESKNIDHDEDEQDDISALRELIQRQSITSPRLAPAPTSSRSSDVSLQIAQKMAVERRRMEEEHREISRGVENILQDLDRETAAILKKRQAEEDARKEKERAAQEKLDKEEAHARQQEEKAQAKEQAKQEAHTQAKQKEREERQKRADATAAKTEYIVKAKKLVGQLVQVRESIEPFEKNKSVSKRRLGMKKIVRGKINTLAENAQKIQQVATEVGQAISQARQDDDQIKQALERKEPGYTSDMARGKRYLVDLLASNVIQRIQADGFNGPRGDGFPLASMLALVSQENKELVPIMAAHIYTVCPVAIPSLPTPKKDATEDELMESLGMQKDKNGDYETFDKFLTRTESVVTFVSNVMASSPSTHVLLGGNKGAVEWLERFLRLLPDHPAAPLPLLTAPVLYGFLSGAGHMLANKHSEIFKQHIEAITESVMNRLDDGPIGKPSSIRLQKLLDGGFDKFKSTLPERALPVLYFGADQSAGQAHGGGQLMGSSTGFGSSTSQASGNTFKAGTSTGNTVNPFGGPSQTGMGSAPSNPFGGTGGTASTPSSFGNSSAATAQSQFGGASVSGSGFGASSSGMPATMPSLQSNPFGTSSVPSNTGFGASSIAFGGATPAPSQFGYENTSATPFASNPPPFGAPASAPTASSFGISTGSSANATFGPANVASPSPFGGGAPFNQSSFGATSGSGFGQGRGGGSSTSFGGGGRGNSGGRGGGGGNSSTKPCKFFAQGRCRFGDKCKFSHETGGGRGGGFGGSSGRSGFSNNTAGFGQSSTGFGGGPSPFGGGSNISSFGGPRR